MAGAVQAVRGMNDLPPDTTEQWRTVEHKVFAVLESYGYREIRFPVVEKTELYRRSIGEVTDIVEKEMYSFEDRNGDSLSLRPEGTAGCVRAGIENGLFHNQIQRLWYAGPMFRHERPQKGRYRQFHQIGVECYGMPGPDIDAEILLLTARLWRALGIEGVRLQINSLGSASSRLRYREALVAFLAARRTDLDEDSQRRLHTNPLRVLDSKSPETQALLVDAPRLLDYLDAESEAHFAGVRELLAAAGLPAEINPRLVRGLDYYNRTVFEWVADGLGAQSTICAGGRYDGLVAQLGGGDVPAVGFALGLERLMSLVAATPRTLIDAYVVVENNSHMPQAVVLSELLREAGLRVLLHCGGGSLKSQLRRADRSGARLALFATPDERLVVKDLLSGTQREVMRADLVGQVRSEVT